MKLFTAVLLLLMIPITLILGANKVAQCIGWGIAFMWYVLAHREV